MVVRPGMSQRRNEHRAGGNYNDQIPNKNTTLIFPNLSLFTFLIVSFWALVFGALILFVICLPAICIKLIISH